MLNIDRSALDALAALLLERAGLKVNPDAYYALKLALTTRMPALGISDATDYVNRLKELAGEHELRSLLPLVTVGKTEFFRDSRQFAALEKQILPELLRTARREARSMSIWSAGCATGEEPYSLAMLLSELGALVPDVRLLATDINLAAIEQAKAGRFTRRRMVGISPERVAQHFIPLDEDTFEAGPALKRFVTFDGLNLASSVFAQVAPGTLDLILCRNVIIYFDLPTIRRVMERFLQSLRPGGLLLLGYSESLYKVYEHFEMVEVEGAFIYRRPGGALRPSELQALRPSTQPPELPPPELSASGYEARGIRLPRVPTPKPAFPATPAAPPPPKARPAPPRPSSAPPMEPAPPRTPLERLDRAVESMNRGQFERALSELKALAQDEPNDLDALLTLGNVHGLMGNSQEAKAAFALALSREPLCVEARIFGGVAALQAQNFSEAQAELQKALFLEPTLAIGHYLLAQGFERGGNKDAARRAYRNALAQLRFPQRPLAGHYPDMPESIDGLARAARYALAALEEL